MYPKTLVDVNEMLSSHTNKNNINTKTRKEKKNNNEQIAIVNNNEVTINSETNYKSCDNHTCTSRQYQVLIIVYSNTSYVTTVGRKDIM